MHLKTNNMSKYKLIKEYPSSPEMGTIVSLGNFMFYLSKDNRIIVYKDFVEGFPEYWEKVEESLEHQRLFSVKDVMDTLPFEDGKTREYAWSHLLKKAEEIKNKKK